MIESFKFNVVVARIMELVNATRKAIDGDVGAADPAVREAAEAVAIALNLFAPYTAEDMWEMLGHEPTVALAGWRQADPTLLVEDSVTAIVQVDGKVRDRLHVPAAIGAEELERLARASEAVTKYVGEKTIATVVVRPPRLVNVVTRRNNRHALIPPRRLPGRALHNLTPSAPGQGPPRLASRHDCPVAGAAHQVAGRSRRSGRAADRRARGLGADLGVLRSGHNPHDRGIRRALPAPRRTLPRVFVHILGAVAKPGLYELHDGDRAVDAIAAAGGFTAKADQQQLNLARLVSDGEQIYVPEIGEVPGPSSRSTDGTAAGAKVNLNTADQSTLETLPRVGPAMAARIIAWREANGRFSTIEDLMNITGIGEKTFADLKDLVTV